VLSRDGADLGGVLLGLEALVTGADLVFVKTLREKAWMRPWCLRFLST